MPEKIALFDFCETLANFQTGDAFVNYVSKNYPIRVNIFRNIIRRILHKTKVIYAIERIHPKLSFNKRLVLWQLRGYELGIVEDAAKEYYENVVKPNLIPETIGKMIELQNEGWRILIVSAGYEVYLKYFCNDFNIAIEDLIAVKIKFNKRNICLGKFDGGDRLWDKVEVLTARFKGRKIQSIAISDGHSDLPMLKWADEGIVVRKRNKTSWNKNNNFKELIWD